MIAASYQDFVAAVAQHKVLPFSNCLSNYPSMSELAKHNEWHADLASDPWQWRIKIVYDGFAAYGKFFNDKPWFIDIHFFPYVQALLSQGKTVDERYYDGLMSRSAYTLYEVISENPDIDARELRKVAGFKAKEQKKDYEDALKQLQSYGDIVINGAKKQDEEGNGWSSMSYTPAHIFIKDSQLKQVELDTSNVQAIVREQLVKGINKKHDDFFSKKLGL